MPRQNHARPRRAALRAGAAALIFGAVAVPALAQTVLPRVEIIGTSPLPGQGIARNLLPYNTQVMKRETLEDAQTETLSDFMARRMSGVQVNDVQGSPFQSDITFRGYRASGLLGVAQGISVYLDGVRINEAFGDVVNWDMVPEFAIGSVALIPGANPAFGLNSLGGALSLTTLDGRSAPGLRAELTVGSLSRKRIDLSHGGTSEDGWHHYVSLGLFDEDGWRDFSEGRLGNLVAKLGRDTEAGEFSLGLLVARSRLVGNGLVPLYTLGEDGQRTPDLGALRRSAVYTYPDLTRNHVTQLSANWRHDLDDRSTLEALAYVRRSTRETINGDEADEVEGDANAAFNRTATSQRGVGASLALSRKAGAHQWQVGASVDRARVSYEQTEQAGRFTPSRGVEPLDEPAELSAEVAGHGSNFGVYATDTWRVAPATHLTGTLRLNQARVSNQLGSVDDDTGEWVAHPNESFRYRSWNPALGIAHRLGDPGEGPTLFANLARNNRVPTVIELGCADPEEPCRLPAGLQADPYLKQVVATTVEAGLRFGAEGETRGSLTLYRSNNRNDIVFSSISVNSQLGFFRNFDRTRHQGLDAELQTRVSGVDLGLTYSLLDATYQAHGSLRMGERNVQVVPGTRIAGLPRHQLKMSADWRPISGATLGVDVQLVSRRGTAGNEDGLIENGGEQTVDLGVPGYAIANLRGTWRVPEWGGVKLFARVTNLFNRRYASYGALAATQFDANGHFTGGDTDAVFVAPGAPRAIFVGLRKTF